MVHLNRFQIITVNYGETNNRFSRKKIEGHKKKCSKKVLSCLWTSFLERKKIDLILDLNIYVPFHLLN